MTMIVRAALTVYWQQVAKSKNVNAALCAYLEGTRKIPMHCREIAVQWKSDIMERNRPYASMDELWLAINGKGPGEAPLRLESGPFFPGAQRKGRRNVRNHIYPKELGFDVDITDYTEERREYGPGLVDCVMQ